MGKDAPHIWVQALTIPVSASVTMETSGSSTGADPVMHLFSVSGAAYTQVAYNDNYSGGDLESRIAFTNTTGVTDFVLLVRARTPGTSGTANLTVGSGSWEGVPIGGERIFSGQIHRDDDDVTSAVPTPGGSVYPALFGFDSPDADNIIEVGLSGGCGGATTVSATTAVRRYLVGTPCGPTAEPGEWSCAREGLANLYVNDVLDDVDGDGLGAALEAELTTCPEDGATCYPGTVSADDTDRDGLLDGEELLGACDPDGNPSRDLSLPRWGANPLHKDYFVEVDWVSDLNGDDVGDPHLFMPPYHSTVAPGPLEWAQAVVNPYTDTDPEFAGGTAAILRNPDGVDGLAIHMDLGVAPVDPADEVLYGDWGDENHVIVPDLIINVTGPVVGTVQLTINGNVVASFDATPFPPALITTALYLGVLISGEPVQMSSQVGSQVSSPTSTIVFESSVPGLHFSRSLAAPPNQPITVTAEDADSILDHKDDPNYRHPVRRGRVRYGAIVRYTGGGQNVGVQGFKSSAEVEIFGHELGHSTGLEHHGHDQWFLPPGEGINGRITPNCMPHYQSFMNYAWDSGVAYADYGLSNRSTPMTLNSSEVSERVTGLGFDAALLGASPFDRDVFGADLIDWNLDGAIDPWPLSDLPWSGGPLRLASWNGCSAFSAGRQELTTNRPIGSVDIATAEGRMWAVYADPTGVVRQRSAALGSSALNWCTGPANPLDYPLSGAPDYATQGCLSWASALAVAGFSGSYAGVSIASYDDLLFVAALRQESAGPPPTFSIELRWFDASSGSLVPVGTEDLGVGQTFGQPELGVLQVGVGSAYEWPVGTGRALVLVRGRAADSRLRINRWNGTSFQFDSPLNPIRDSSGADILGVGAAALVTWPDPSTPVGSGIPDADRATCAIFPSTVGGMRPYCFDNTTNRWVDQADSAWSALGTTSGGCSTSQVWDPDVGASGRCLRLTTSQPSLAFHYPRRSAQPFPTDEENGVGNAYLSYRTPSGLNRVAISAPVSAAAPLFPLPRLDEWIDSFGSDWQVTQPGSNTPLYGDLTIGGLVALEVDSGNDNLSFYPHADGTPPVPLRAGNDFAVIEAFLCDKLGNRHVTRCVPEGATTPEVIQ